MNEVETPSTLHVFRPGDKTNLSDVAGALRVNDYALKIAGYSGFVAIVQNGTVVHAKNLGEWKHAAPDQGLLSAMLQRSLLPYNAKNEKQYLQVRPSVLMEELALGQTDYKFWCLWGKCEFLWVDLNRFHDHEQCFYDTEWRPLNVTKEAPCRQRVPRPRNFARFLQTAERLAHGFPHVRIDLYSPNNPALGEFTFTTDSGNTKFTPRSFDRYLLERLKGETAKDIRRFRVAQP